MKTFENWHYDQMHKLMESISKSGPVGAAIDDWYYSQLWEFPHGFRKFGNSFKGWKKLMEGKTSPLAARLKTGFWNSLSGGRFNP